MFSNFTKITKSGLKSFWRNGWLSTATISVMVLTLFVITGLLMLNVVGDALFKILQDKIDISVYFNLDTPEEDILKVKSELENLGEVKNVEYVSREVALKIFKEKHQDNLFLLQALKELESNPLEASLNIKAQEASQYEAISNFLEGGYYKDIIDKVNYKQNKEVIGKLSNIITNVRKAGVGLSGIFILIVILITFSAIRLTMYSSREEIRIMRLVGASNWFIRGPFIVEGALYGIFSSFAAIGLLYPTFLYTSPKLSGFLPIPSLFSYFQANLWSLFFLLLGIGVFLGVISSLIAIRRYLKA